MRKWVNNNQQPGDSDVRQKTGHLHCREYTTDPHNFIVDVVWMLTTLMAVAVVVMVLLAVNYSAVAFISQSHHPPNGTGAIGN